MQIKHLHIIAVMLTLLASCGQARQTAFWGDVRIRRLVPDVQTGPIVNGQVVSLQTGLPLPRAQVFVLGDTTGVLSDSEGGFSLSPRTPGHIALSVQRLGFQRGCIHLDLAAGEAVNLLIGLEVGPLIAETSVVTSDASVSQELECLGTDPNGGSAELVQSRVLEPIGPVTPDSSQGPVEPPAPPPSTSSAVVPTLPLECGGNEVREAEFRLEFYLDFYVEEDRADSRERHGVQQLPPDVETEILSDPEECSPIIERVLEAQAERLSGNPDLGIWSYDFAILRYGPYITVPLGTVQPPPPLIIHGITSVFILDATSGEVLADYLMF